MMDEEPTIAGGPPSFTDPDGASALRFGKRYRPLALLGSGGMGTVYLTRDEELDELVAVKVLRPELLERPSMLERFRDEVRLARLVSSPFVARTHDLAEHEGRWFVTMQYIEGETLSAKLQREGRLSLFDTVRIAREVCEGLSAVHAAGVVHRDLKPGNVLISRAGHAVLTDFGIAIRAESHRATTDRSGTRAYAAPEQLAGHALDARADVFAMGTMLYAMATGQIPLPAARRGNEPPPDPRRAAIDLPDAFATIVMRAMALDPRDRFPSADAVGSAISALTPAEPHPRDSMLGGFVRSLCARETRKMYVAPLEVKGVPESLFDAARVELLAHLQARGGVWVVEHAEYAEAVLHSRLARHGDAFVLDLALRSRDGDYEFWAKTLRGALAVLPQLVERAALDIERAFDPTSDSAVASTQLPSAEVARLFVEARAEYRGFWGGRLRRSTELFERARALAPEHPLVLAWCAAAQSRLAFFESGQELGEGHQLALRAVDLAPDLAEARIALAASHMLHMRVVEAIPHYVEALEIAPGLSEQRVHFARVLHEIGAERAALDLATSTFERDPSLTEALIVMIHHHGLRGRMDLAEAELARAQDDSLVQINFARACLWCRDSTRFGAMYQRIGDKPLEREPRNFLDLVAGLFAAQPVDLSRKVGDVIARRRAFFAQVRAEAYAFLGDTHRCLTALEFASELGLFDVPWLDRCPLFDELRGTVRFEVVRRAAHERALQALMEIERCLSAP